MFSMKLQTEIFYKTKHPANQFFLDSLLCFPIK